VIGCEFAAGGGRFRGDDRGLHFGRKRHRRFMIHSGQPGNNMGDLILHVGREIASDSKSLTGERPRGACKITADAHVINVNFFIARPARQAQSSAEPGPGLVS
jgi:hypothetical protein